MFHFDYNYERVAVRNRDSSYISLLGYARGSTLGLAGLFGNIGRLAASEKRVTQRIWASLYPYICKEKHLHMLHTSMHTPSCSAQVQLWRQKSGYEVGP